MHRTQSDFDDNLTFKVFIFQFINFYSSIIYIAFFKGKFVGYPGAYINIMFNLRNEDVSSSNRNFSKDQKKDKRKFYGRSFLFTALKIS